MCTGIAMKAADFYFGRNMDLDYHFGEQVIVTPRNYTFKFRKELSLKSHYAMIGMGMIEDNYPLYAECVNEKGLCIAGLNFPGSAYYSCHEDINKHNISPFELIPWLLGKCKCVSEAEKLLSVTHIIGIPFNKSLPLASLHWLIADRTKSIVLEITRDGMHIYDNPVHVLTNNPGFDFHMTNLSHYLNLTVKSPKNIFCSIAGIKPFGAGLGSFGLPGDFSPSSRFVKTAYLLCNSKCGTDEESCVSQFFHILDSVAVVNGSVESASGSCYMTTYSCCVNADKGIYYYKTYNNNQLTAVSMNRENLEGECLKSYVMVKSQQIMWEN